MTLSGSSAAGSITIASEEPSEGFLSSIHSGEILRPVPFVCPAGRRTLF
jgi:hypothetical protein